jgi:DNA-binding transcriptional regulator YdaS (Cro superfamily)
MVALTPLLVDNASMNIFLTISNEAGTQAKAAGLIGVSTSAYSAWVVGEKKPSIKNTKKIEKLFGIPREQLRPDIYLD